jgi:hypothetical protein
MPMQYSRRDEQDEDKRRLIRLGKRAIVQCDGYRCLAYVDGEGKWRNVADDLLVPKVSEIVEVVLGPGNV